MGKRADFEELRDLTRLLVGRTGRLEARADEVAMRLERLQARSTPDAAIDYWLEERVLALAVHRARSIGVERADWAEAEDAIRERAKAAATIQDLALMQVTRALQKEGIPSVVLKGAPMARRLYGEAELRAPSGDLDLLVPVEQLDAASAVVVGLGWEGANDPIYGNGLPIHHLAHGGRAGVPSVELHWRVQWYDEVTHSAQILRSAVREREVWVPAPGEQLSVLLHAFGRDAFHGLRLAADVAALWDRYENDAPSLDTALHSYPLERTHRCLAAAVSAVVGTPCADRASLGQTAVLLGGLALADRPMSARTKYARAATIDVLAAPRGRRLSRIGETWLRNPDFLAAKYPALTRTVGPGPVRVASALRSAIRVPSMAVDIAVETSRHRTAPD